MSFDFGDGFDLYTAVADMVNGYWDSQVGGSLVAGRFAGSRALSFTAAGHLVIKTSAVNDAVHHVQVSYQQTAAISGTTLGNYIAFFDGANAQCTIVFKSNGDIILAQGNALGTVLDTYVGAVGTANTWFAFEFEVVIDGAAGSWAVRKNGNNVNDRALGGLNTRGGSTNNYANKLQLGQNASVNAQQFDNAYWRSGAVTGNWLGDIRCDARMPASDVSAMFVRLGSVPYTPQTTGITGGINANFATYTPFVPTVDGTIASLILSLAAGYTGNMKTALFNSAGTLIATANVLNNPATGNNTITFPSPGPVLDNGTTYYIGFNSDTTAGTYNLSAGSTAPGQSISYASFPPATASYGAAGRNPIITVFVTPTDNYSSVNDPQQDGTFTYVYSFTPGDSDFYGISPLSFTPAVVIATTLRLYAQKSDAGTRTMAAQLKSGAATVASPTIVLTTSGFLWTWRTDITDPNTGLAWTPVNANNVQIGPTVIA